VTLERHPATKVSLSIYENMLGYVIMTEADELAQPNLLVELTSSIVAAYVGNHVVPVAELRSLIFDVHTALFATTTPKAEELAVAEKPKPAVSVRKSIQDDQITCLECGHSYKSLKRHLMSSHSETPEEYRAKWALADDYPMVAPAYAEARSRLAKEMGLGQVKKKAA
jgi:predicted transcriptional regulator